MSGVGCHGYAMLVLTEGVDDSDPFLDPMEPITATWLAGVAERISKSLTRSAGTASDVQLFSILGTSRRSMLV